ncbi:phenylacetate--CoA ligase family protein [Bacillus sp. S/N-304-OC-R1]|uniref:phenylacetate--CoA ligase family protein n=1 Tax=Bacillus sp. S/N-304-OC-R1 TaxID=2758034 RepID=UPI001C8D0EAB|nr:phenylacetate--CoA ligase family protein [Bacillus sp. S/N-304-OC-R1]MBY0121408.1 phenylacetate--CoA ligase family protein [Bacillus sp. S/N-304-OC-R1]
MDALKAVIQYAYDHAAGFKAVMAESGLTPNDIQTVHDLDKIPVLKKDQLPELQARNLPFGKFATIEAAEMARIFMSPGPIYDPQTHEGDFWRFSEALAVAGFGKGDIVQNTFSYHLSPAGFMFDSALRRLGAAVIPAGTGNRELQIQVMKDLQVTGYTGTPSFFSILLDAIEEKGWTIGKEIVINKVFFTAEMVTADMKRRCEENGILIYEGYGTADCGCIAYEDKAGPGLKVTNSAIVQICDPLTGEAVVSSEGEIVVTLLDKSYPLIRFGTGDLSRWVEGYEGERIAGILGRVSDGVKVKGMFVRERQLTLVLSEAGYDTFQGIVTKVHGQDEFELLIETEEELSTKLIGKIQDVIRIKPILKKVPLGSINRKEKRIVDKRIMEVKNS